MAFTATTGWDVRTGGSDANGGGFDAAATGTDRSVADSPFIAFTDLVIDGPTNTKCTSSKKISSKNSIHSDSYSRSFLQTR